MMDAIEAHSASVELEAQKARAQLVWLEQQCKALPDEHRMDESPPLKHWVCDGIYMREIHLPTDSLVVGKIHKHDHLNIISKGRVTVFTEFGLDEISAPATFISKAGTKRSVYTHEDCIWTTIHHNADNEQDVSVLEDRFTTNDYAALGLKVADMKSLEGDKE